jgi:protein-disulfide isomerase
MRLAAFHSIRRRLRSMMRWARVLGAAVVLAACGAAETPSALDSSAMYAVPLSGNVIGPEDALVTIVVAGDFQCSFCEQAAQTLGALLETYPDDLRLSFMHMPLSFHERALPAAIAAECAAEQDRFWAYHDALFAGAPALADDDLRAYAEQVDIDVVPWVACLGSDPPRDRVAEQQSLMRSFGVRGTPSSFVNGRFIRGARDFDELAQIVEEQRSDAQGVIDSQGIAAERYYAHHVLENGIRP